MLQVILGVLPVILLLIYISLPLYDNMVLGYVFIGVMVITAAFNITISKRYNVLLSGFKGEKSVLKSIKKLGDGYMVFSNLPIRYKKNRSEIDLLIVCERYIMIVEVKNHSGYIYGTHKAKSWTQRKIYKHGKTVEIQMENPVKQIRRQRDILKSILLSNGVDAWVDTTLYFSSPSVHLYLDLFDSDNLCSSENELLKLLRTYKSPKPLDAKTLENVKKVLKEISMDK